MPVTAASDDVDRVTRRFYDRFQKEREEFLSALGGDAARGDRERYASVTLNRLMFVYFVQKRGFLDGDPDYLRNRLRRVRQKRGPGHFHPFYLRLLRRLFHDRHEPPEAGAGAPLGNVPHLNDDVLDPHEPEEVRLDFDVPDEAFGRVFDFFDDYRWRLDDRPPADDREINPDVLGHVFEKFVNQKQMGAYYTKEDVTEYIARNTIVPFLLGATSTRCPAAFRPGGPVWGLVRDDPDRYLFEAVRRGVDRPLPPEIAAGLGDGTKRGGWDRPAAAGFALPTETWREQMARRRRCHELRDRMRAGAVCVVNDLVTLNLDVRRLARDVIDTCDDPVFVRTFWAALQNVSVLDPTCGSGAFLFAAARVLEPLYDACLERMRAMLREAKRPDEVAHFRATLGSVEGQPSRRAFVLKSILVNNLYGVDVLKEATEVCKLRLLLKVIARAKTGEELGTLADLRFNVRVGNTLVGFVRPEEVRKPRGRGPDAAGRPGGVREDLDACLAREHGIDPGGAAYAAWRGSHKPFHWFAEFGGVMGRGGFDVLIGNPPYVDARKVREEYTVRGLATASAPDVYAWCLERAAALAGPHGRTGMIVPLSLAFSGDFRTLRRLLFGHYSENWFSSFGRIPSALFRHDVRVRHTIHLGARNTGREQHHTTRLHRWFEEARPVLFDTLEYAPFTPSLWAYRVPKFNTPRLGTALEACVRRAGATVRDVLARGRTASTLYFKKTAYNWLAFSRESPPCYAADGRRVGQPQVDSIALAGRQFARPVFLLLNGKLAYLFWCVVGDDFHVTRRSIAEFPLDVRRLVAGGRARRIAALADELEAAMRGAVVYKRNAGKNVGNYNLARCRHVTDRSDRMFAEHLGLEQAWEDVELYYAQVVRTDFGARGGGAGAECCP